MNVICYGDSNTWGYDPRSYWGNRYDTPWPKHLANITGWNVENWGQNGREIPREMASCSCELLIVMLGTNDLLQGASAQETANRMEIFLSQLLSVHKQILLVCPPPMNRGAWVSEDGLVAESHLLAEEYRLLANRVNVPFVDTSHWNIELSFDGVHFTESGHHRFADALTKELLP
jgi:lysophospholipase L1-like esterase